MFRSPESICRFAVWIALVACLCWTAAGCVSDPSDVNPSDSDGGDAGHGGDVDDAGHGGDVDDDTGCSGEICSGECVDLSTNLEHCGACGVSCADLANVEVSSCSDGECTIEECAEGFANLDGSSATGCELECPAAVEAANFPGLDDQLQGCELITSALERTFFVAAHTESTGGSGTPFDPFDSIQAAVDAAAASDDHHQVYVANGLYSEMVTLHAGVSLWGGFDASGGGLWTRREFDSEDTHIPEDFDELLEYSDERSIIYSPESIGVLASGHSEGIISGFAIYSADADGESAMSSRAVIVEGAEGFVIEESWLRPGDGADGADGQPGAKGTDGGDGEDGSSGEKADGTTCDEDTEEPVAGQGGPGGENPACEDGAGGRGGHSTLGSGYGGPGRPGGDAGSLDGGDGGNAGEPQTCFLDPSLGELLPRDGSDGGNGYREISPGSGGVSLSGQNLGELVGSSDWQAGAGLRGVDGKDGAGGGGGGAGGHQRGACASFFTCENLPAGGGGGGGAGGCGGEGGESGEGGGGSIALMLIESEDVVVRFTRFSTGNGGSGGDGGAGGQGGQGGSGGAGGAGVVGPDASVGGNAETGAGGDGGDGGGGARGGGGSAGAGGMSVAIFSYDSAVVSDEDNEFVIGDGGEGGEGGAPNGTMGYDGTAQEIFDELPLD